MTKFDWVLLIGLWSLIPLALFIDRKQKEKYKRWAKEDAENVAKFIESDEIIKKFMREHKL